MLAESFLSIFAYNGEPFDSRQGQVLKPVVQETWQSQCVNMDDNGQFFTESDQAAADKMAAIGGGNTDLKGHRQIPVQDVARIKTHKTPLSTRQRIPIQDEYCGKELDLYQSWSSQSLYQNYPDLHIGGDHIADHTPDSDRTADQTYSKLPGPVLLSTDIPLDAPFPLQKPRVLKSGHGDDVGLISMVPHKEPLSNSLLNNHMEHEIQEVYKQFWEEKLTHCHSISHFLMSNGLTSNIAETQGHQQTLLQPLARLALHNTSTGNSSEFSTPNLQISAPLCKRKCL